ncbi:hypothetical protein QJS10_CPA09g00713 [Acorus calamus]|uniref:Uncharacterized protein n=1 Tax=Acorus calamus TaxID=4465 RepID=A0AAV9E8H4_ACOCL|nr:hypothetical protein QJS10_CPA09g00713 [Acorus calamus]
MADEEKEQRESTRAASSEVSNQFKTLIDASQIDSIKHHQLLVSIGEDPGQQRRVGPLQRVLGEVLRRGIKRGCEECEASEVGESGPRSRVREAEEHQEEDHGDLPGCVSGGIHGGCDRRSEARSREASPARLGLTSIAEDWVFVLHN